MGQDSKADLHESGLSRGIKDFVAGTLAGIAQVTIPYPLDTIKTRLQTQSTKDPQFKGAIDCLTKTIKQEGVGGLYKGVLSPVAGVAFLNAELFWCYGQIELQIKSYTGKEYMTLPQVFLCGATSGLILSSISGPIELVKTRMQVQYSGNGAAYSGTIDCARKIVQSQGIQGLYKGIVPTILREIPAYGSWYCTYEFVRRSFAGSPEKTRDLNPLQLMFSGACGGVAYVTSSYPIDVVKSIIQGEPHYVQSKYSGFLDCAKQLYAEKGLAGFGRGYLPGVGRAIPAASVTFLTFETVKKILG